MHSPSSLNNSKMNKPLKITHLNCKSLRNKIIDTIDLINAEEIYILCLNETHLNENDHHTNSIICYNIIRNDRLHSRGGGVAIILKKTNQIQNNKSTKEAEYITIELKNNLKIMATYNHPKSKSNLNYIADFVKNNNNVIILGRFNALSLL